MKYKNAKEALPPGLFKEVQKYAGGNLLYVPLAEEKNRGEVSGQKQYYRKRNRLLQNKYLYGVSVDELAKEYSLSRETVKKIVYEKQGRDELKFTPGVQSAKEYSDNGLLEEWIHTYLLFERKNKKFSDGLYLEERHYLGPLAMPLSSFVRSSGPEEGIKWQVHPVVFENKVNAWRDRIRGEQILPPVIVGYADGGFEINCNNPLFEALIREGVTCFPCIMWTTKKEDYEDFVKKYASYTEFVLNKVGINRKVIA